MRLDIEISKPLDFPDFIQVLYTKEELEEMKEYIGFVDEVDKAIFSFVICKGINKKRLNCDARDPVKISPKNSFRDEFDKVISNLIGSHKSLKEYLEEKTKANNEERYFLNGQPYKVKLYIGVQVREDSIELFYDVM